MIDLPLMILQKMQLAILLAIDSDVGSGDAMGRWREEVNWRGESVTSVVRVRWVSPLLLHLSPAATPKCGSHQAPSWAGSSDFGQGGGATAPAAL